jgi:curved DNA-binding protein CbpA
MYSKAYVPIHGRGMSKTLLDACEVLLGPQAKKDAQALLHRLNATVIKRAFRRLALLTHPDVAPDSAVAPGPGGASRFIEAFWAYEQLLEFLKTRRGATGQATARQRSRRSAGSPTGRHPSREGRHSPRSRAQATPRQRSGSQVRTAYRAHGSAGKGGISNRGRKGAAWFNAQSAWQTRDNGNRTEELYYRGPLPRRSLRFAEYLYYSGTISWRSLIGAILWQRLGRPRFGEIAFELRAISGEELRHLLQSKRRDECIGQTASRLRLLTAEAVEEILRCQRARQRLIGMYFIETQQMTHQQVAKLLMAFFRHNVRYESSESSERSGRSA